MTPPTTVPLQSDWAHGPVASRRFGRSLEVNLLPAGRKLCTFDCVYCQYDATPDAEPTGFPTSEEVWRSVQEALQRRTVDAITIAGNGEPTLHPQFARTVAGLAALRDTHAPDAALVLLSNGSRLAAADVREGLRWIDRPFFKLDGGDETTLRLIDRPRGASLAHVLEGLRSLRVTRYALQAMFVMGARENCDPESVERWIDVVVSLAPREVHVTTIDRGTTVAGLMPVSGPRLVDIAGQARDRGIPAQAFPSADEVRFS